MMSSVSTRLSTSMPEMEKEKQRASMSSSSSLVPFLQGTTPATSSASSLFPLPPLLQGLQNFYTNLLHHQLLNQLAASSQSPTLLTDESAVHSAKSPPREDSPCTKKLCVEEDGTAVCPVCGERLLEESGWAEHVETEKKTLVSLIRSLKTSSASSLTLFSSSSDERAASRHFRGDLDRIRENKEKRKALKNAVGLLERKSPLTPRNQIQGSDEQMKKEEEVFQASASTLQCSLCRKNLQRGTVSTDWEGVRCDVCFSSLPPRPPLLDGTDNAEKKTTADEELPPSEKRMKLEM